MAVVVLRQLYGLAVNGYAALVYAVGIAADGCSKVAAKVFAVGILCYIVVAKHHVLHLSVAVGHHNRHNAGSEVGEAHLHTLAVAQGVEMGLLALNVHLEVRRVKPRQRKVAHTVNHRSRSHSRWHIAHDVWPAVYPVDAVEPHLASFVGSVGTESVV